MGTFSLGSIGRILVFGGILTMVLGGCWNFQSSAQSGRGQQRPSVSKEAGQPEEIAPITPGTFIASLGFGMLVAGGLCWCGVVIIAVWPKSTARSPALRKTKRKRTPESEAAGSGPTQDLTLETSDDAEQESPAAEPLRIPYHQVDGSELSADQQLAIEQTIRAFMEALGQDQPPDIDDFLPRDAVLRPVALRGLICREVEFRLREGDSAPLSEYLDRFRTTAPDDPTERQVRLALFEGRWRAGQRPKLESYVLDPLSPGAALLFEELLRTDMACRKHWDGAAPAARFYLKQFPAQTEAVRRVYEPSTAPVRFQPSRELSPPRPPDAKQAAGSEADLAPTFIPVDNRIEATRTYVAPPELKNEEYRLAEAPDPAQKGKEPLPRTIGRFRIQELLGQGTFGRVYRAYDPHLDRDVALKVPKLVSGREDLVERFYREAKSAARLRHPHIVAVHDAGRETNEFYIAAEFIEGETLAARIKRGRPTFQRAAGWIRDLALALH